MGLARTWSVALLGVDGRIVEIEADVGGGLPRFQLVGLPDAALHEAKDRIRAAITNSGRTWPNERIVLALSPASLRKTGSGFDLVLARTFLPRTASRREPGPPVQTSAHSRPRAGCGRLDGVRRRSGRVLPPARAGAGLHVCHRVRQAPPHHTVVMPGNLERADIPGVGHLRPALGQPLPPAPSLI